MRHTAESTSDIISAAMGQMHADTILENCKMFSVYTGETLDDMQIAMHGDRISYVGYDASYAKGKSTKVIDVNHKYVSPGFADPHVHIDQFVMPSEFTKQALLCGVTALFSDPIDVTSVAGYKGFEAFLDAGRNLPIRIFHTVPGGLPVDPRFSRRDNKGITHSRQIKLVRDNPDVLGMGEVFAWTKVTERDPSTIKSISNMVNHNCIINGHTAGASEKKLGAYVAAGILSCHEPIDFDQVIKRLQLGMWVMIREGSIRRDLAAIVPYIVSKKTYVDRLMFCSDGVDPAAIRKYGYIDYCVKEAVRCGIKPVDAIIMATRNVFDYYKMERDLGGIAPGRLADILVLADDASFKPSMVMVGGKTVVAQGRLTVDIPTKRVPSWTRRTVKIPKKVHARDFEIKSVRNPARANTIVLKTEIITGLGSVATNTDQSRVVTPDQTACKVAAFGRTGRKGRLPGRSVVFLQGFGDQYEGAFASTWSFHENDMIIIGSNDADMALAANHLRRCGGGVAVARNGEITASMPLEFAGIVSTKPFDSVLKQYIQIHEALADSGCRFERPVLVPLFLPFLALPSVRITSDGGMIDVKMRQVIKPLVYDDDDDDTAA